MLWVLVNVKCNFMKFELPKSRRDEEESEGRMGPEIMMKVQKARQEGREEGVEEGISNLMRGTAGVLFQHLGNPQVLEKGLGKGAAMAVTLLKQALESQGCAIYGTPGDVIGEVDPEDFAYQPVRAYDDMSTVKSWKVLSSGVRGPSGKLLLPAKIDEA